jgi:hypothetical protein
MHGGPTEDWSGWARETSEQVHEVAAADGQDAHDEFDRLLTLVSQAEQRLVEQQ